MGGFFFEFERISGESATRYTCHTQATTANYSLGCASSTR